MVSSEWRELKARFVCAIENTPIGSYSLEGARLAPEVFRYSVSPELAASILYNAWTFPNEAPEKTRAARTDLLHDFLREEEEDRIAAGVLISPDEEELNLRFAQLRWEAEAENAVRDSCPDPADNL